MTKNTPAKVTDPNFTVTTGPLPASRKIFVESPRFKGVKVAMREITLAPEAKEPPVRVYDTSGVYSDTNAHIDITRGLAKLREEWIEARGDTEKY
ncbi:MAG: phosphomethylpyrimidine synthase, partial [Proteobacteria bacterium]|nr:phosphomethylpyrimidine synthase [Pseudomonadota bacterium]